MDQREPRQILIVEPNHAGMGHVPFNRAFVATVKRAFPDAAIVFACSPEHRREIAADQGVAAMIAAWVPIDAWPSSEQSFGELWRRLRWLARLRSGLQGANARPEHTVLLGSSGPILCALEMARWLRWRRTKLFVVLHGNAGGLIHGWRPRNPLRRWLSFDSAFQRGARSGVKAIVPEAWVAERLITAHACSPDAIVVIPHAVDEADAASEPVAARPAVLARPILFIGQATLDKGFREFAAMARLARERGLQALAFRAVGALRRDAADVDMSALERRPGAAPVARAELVAEIAAAKFAFMWHSEHYETSPSGVLVDCIAHGVPLCGRRSAATESIERENGAIGIFEDNLDALLARLTESAPDEVYGAQASVWKANLYKARLARSPAALARLTRKAMLGERDTAGSR